jgi:HlyD family secretion protein
VEIRAPVSGYVHELAVHTNGGVVSPGETLMLIVPEKDALVVQARIDPQHIDQVEAGRPAHVRFTSFSSRSTPELSGQVDNVSADAETDEKTGAQYYTARLTLEQASLPKGIAGRLVPGMPAEVQIETGSRSVASYVFKPLADQLHRAFRED